MDLLQKFNFSFLDNDALYNIFFFKINFGETIEIGLLYLTTTCIINYCIISII